MKGLYLSSEHDTSVMGAEPTHVTIIHPHHPLKGQKLELIRVLREPNSRLIVKLPDGASTHLERDWTDYAQLSGAVALPDSTHLLQIEGLRELIKMVDQTRSRRSSSKN
jgi:hypothetical protein